MDLKVHERDPDVLPATRETEPGDGEEDSTVSFSLSRKCCSIRFSDLEGLLLGRAGGSCDQQVEHALVLVRQERRSAYSRRAAAMIATSTT